jgi:IPT/TIG domain
MAQTPHQFINSPGSGNQKWGFLWNGVVAAGGDSISVTVRFWSGANGTGSLVAVSSAQVWLWDFTAGGSVSTQTGSGVNTLTRTSSLSPNGHNIQCSGKFTGAQSVGSMELWMDYTSSSAWIPQSVAFSPSVGGPGTAVTITGSRFTDATSVDFNGTGASFTVDNDGQISTTVPTGATFGPVHVANPAGAGTSGANFTPSTFRVDDGAAWQTANAVWADNGSSWQLCKVWVDDGSTWRQIA